MRLSPKIQRLKNALNRFRLNIRNRFHRRKQHHPLDKPFPAQETITPLQKATICERRQLFPALIREMMVTTSALKGRPSFVLNDINSFTDAELEGIKPIINDQYQIYVDNDYVCSRLKSEPENTLQLFPRQHENLLVFNLFDGKHTVSEIGQQISEALSWDDHHAFQHTRHLFLLLLNLRVCVPSNPPSESLKEVSHLG